MHIRPIRRRRSTRPVGVALTLTALVAFGADLATAADAAAMPTSTNDPPTAADAAVATPRRSTPTPSGDRVATRHDGPNGHAAASAACAPDGDALRWPTSGRVSSEFGPRDGRLHKGIDVATPTGTPITAAAPGAVSFAGWQGGYGHTVEIEHGDGTMTRYAHLSRVDVALDERVDARTRIGAVGSTGSSTGPHLHFEIWVDGAEQDPREHIACDPPVLRAAA